MRRFMRFGRHKNRALSMVRIFLRLLFLVLIPLDWSCGADAPTAEGNLAGAKQSFDDARVELLKALHLLEERAQKNGDLDAVQAIRDETAAFVMDGTLPASATGKPPLRLLKKWLKRVEDSYLQSIQELTKAGDVEGAVALQLELDGFRRGEWTPLPQELGAARVFAGAWKVEQDEIIQLDDNSKWGFLTFRHLPWRDYDITCEVHTPPLKDSSVQVLFNVANPYHFRELRIRSDGVELHCNSGPARSAVPVLKKELEIPAKWHQVRISVRGSKCENIELDGVRVFDRHDDARYLQGCGVGIGATKGASARLRKVQIANAAGQRLAAGGITGLQPKPNAQMLAAERASAHFQAGTKWSGTRTSRPGVPGSSYYVHVHSRTDNRFMGKRFSNGENRNPVLIEGVIVGADIKWRETLPGRLTAEVSGRLSNDGRVMQLKYSTTWQGGRKDEGIGEIRLSE
ncbi:MAG: hypothetical protein KF708_19910 [Pirellulales bacterium]|nr:hypothetical protein [Pirellulales bacterium]